MWKSRPKKRVDVLLVERGLAEDLGQARALVMAGKVVVGDQRVDKPSEMAGTDVEVRVKERTRYVSRAGQKLEGALADLGLTAAMKDAVVLDVGASTGGFTDCCLQHGAARVVALDVGTNQLAWSLRTDPRVTVLEKTDIRDFVPDRYPGMTWVLADVSFNSLAKLAPALRRAAPNKGVHFLILVKPQFELPKDQVPDGGVVRSDEMRRRAVQAVQDAFSQLGLTNGRVVDSRLPGRSGNVEVFFYVKSDL